MAQKLFTTEEAARKLGITTEKLNELRDRREVFGIRDGAGWKYKEQEIDRVKAELAGGGGDSSDDVFAMPMGEGGAGDSVLLSEFELGEAGSSLSGTVIGKPGTGSPHDSDISLGDEIGSGIGTGSGRKGGRVMSDSDIALSALDEAPGGKKPDSDVTLVADASASDSGVKLVAMSEIADENLANTVELELSDLAMDDSSSDMPLDMGSSGLGSSGLGGSGSKVGSSGIGSDIHGASTGTKDKTGSDLTLDSDALMNAADSGLGLHDSNVKLGEPRKGTGSGTGSSGSHGSAIELGGEFDDDELVLGSHTGSDINDSGISLGDPADSGLSLEQPLQLGGDDMVDDSGMGGQLTADDEFMLTPAVEMGEEELDESGSQVIALDSEADFDDSQATLLGESLPGTAGMLEEDTGGMGGMHQMGPLGAAAAMGGLAAGGPMLAPTQMVVSREAPYSIFNVISLFSCVLFLALTGMMMWDLLRTMWSWDQPYAVNSSLMNSILAMFE